MTRAPPSAMLVVMNSQLPPAPAVVARGISRSYSGRPAVRPLDLTLRTGETVALLGPNGAGKSTTIGMMLGLVTPDSGTITVAGRAPRRAVAEGSIAAMLQDTGFMPGTRVGELVRLGERCYPDPLPAEKALALAGLSDVVAQRVDRLSGGQSQRLRFALAIVANPAILILDEPTRALDVQGRAEFWESMRRFASTGRTVLFATHYLDEVEENANRVVMMAAGRIVADGTPSEIRGRAGAGSIQLTLDEDPIGSDATDAALRELPGVDRVSRIGVRVTLTSSDPDATVRSLSNASFPWHGIQVAPPSMDDTFLRLTENRDASADTAETADALEAADALEVLR